MSTAARMDCSARWIVRTHVDGSVGKKDSMRRDFGGSGGGGMKAKYCGGLVGLLGSGKRCMYVRAHTAPSARVRDALAQYLRMPGIGLEVASA
jgi:hypothetical protein